MAELEVIRETFYDSDGVPVDAGDPDAVTVEVEFRDSDGQVLRTYGTLRLD